MTSALVTLLPNSSSHGQRPYALDHTHEYSMYSDELSMTSLELTWMIQSLLKIFCKHHQCLPSPTTKKCHNWVLQTVNHSRTDIINHLFFLQTVHIPSENNKSRTSLLGQLNLIKIYSSFHSNYWSFSFVPSPIKLRKIVDFIITSTDLVHLKVSFQSNWSCTNTNQSEINCRLHY